MATAEEVSKEATQRSASVLSNWQVLGDILDRHEEALRKRWIRKTKTWKKTILSKTWPNMPAFHRPDMEILYDEELGAESVEKRPRESFLLPYINMEDLSREKSLLFLLHTRARNPPARFVDDELENCRLGIDTRYIVKLSLNDHTMYMEGQTTDTYGKLVAVGDYEGGFNSNSCAGFHPGDGILILEIQQKLMEFLIKCCEAILDKPADTLISQYPTNPEPPPLQDCSLWATTEIMARYAPYFPPKVPRFTRLKSYIKARFSMARDHLFALKEDPGYFADAVYECSEHRQELILDCMGKIHPSYGQSTFWDIAVHDVIFSAYSSLCAWDMIAKQIQQVVTLRKQYARVIDPRHALPPKYMREILIMRALLGNFILGPIASLQHGLPASPPLRSLFVRELLDGTSKTVVRADVDIDLDPLIFLIHKIWDGSKWLRYGPQNLVDEMERLVIAEANQHDRISPWVAEQFAELGLLVRLKHELDSYHPWAAEFDILYKSLKTEIEKETFAKSFAPLRELNMIIPSLTLGKVGCPSNEKFFYPSDKRLCKSNAEDMRKSEQNLDLFWHELERQYEEKNGAGLQKAFGDLFTFNELERTPEWMECPEETSEKCEAQEATTQIDELLKPTSELQFEREKPSTEYTLGIDAYLIKVRDVLPEPNYGQLLDAKGGIQPRFRLDSRAFRVTRALFYKPSDFDGPGEIAWADFLHVMNAVGFTPFKLYGSLWHFSHQIDSAIQFHEPYPHSKISLRVAMQMGRRLKRAYGWNAGVFGLEKGKGKAS